MHSPARRLQAHPVEDANLHRILVLARAAHEPSAAEAAVERIVRGEMNRLTETGLFKPPAPRRARAR